ncbi:MAG: hypothetical protein WD294_11655 [Phycisphaeraceae bacterium]
MRCPKCGEQAERHIRAEGAFDACEACGWGMQRLGGGGAVEAEAGRGGKFWMQLGLMWLITPVILVGPYVGLRWGVLTLQQEFGAATEAMERWLADLNAYYCWVMGAYLLVSVMISPGYDRENMGIFGRGLTKFNWAVTSEQQHNRMMHNVATVLLPGKVVVATVLATWDVLRGR